MIGSKNGVLKHGTWMNMGQLREEFTECSVNFGDGMTNQ